MNVQGQQLSNKTQTAMSEKKIVEYSVKPNFSSILSDKKQAHYSKDN